MIRDEVLKVLNAKAEAVKKAEFLVSEALAILNDVPYVGMDDSIYSRVVNSVGMADYIIRRDKDMIDRRPTETYIGNMAAFELGEAIEKDLNG